MASANNTRWMIDGFLDAPGGRLCIDGIAASDLAAQYGTPLFVFSERRIRYNIDRLKRIADVIPCPLKICYAAKAMSTMGILRAVREAGIDIEVNSGGELWKALKAGFTGDQIIFNGTSKEVWELELAIQNEIYAIQVDSLYELSLIEATAKRLNKRANVSLRLVPEIESGTHSGLQTALLTSKFGMMPDEALQAFAEYRVPPNVNLCGIHLHIGSQNPDPKVYGDALTILFAEIARIYEETGIRLKHVNLGGGFPVDYLEASTAQLSSEIEQMLGANFDPSDAISEAWYQASRDMDAELLASLEVLIEPGRSIIADAGCCLTTVRNVKQRPLSEINRSLRELTPPPPDPPRNASASGLGTGGISFGWYHLERGFVDETIMAEQWLLTDAGFNILLSMETYKWYYHLISADRAGESHDFPYKVAGPLCDGGDVYFDVEGENRLPDYRLLPKEMKPGELLALFNCGAYSLAQASQYNGRGLPPVVLIDICGEPKLIRRRDTFEDLIASDL